MGQLGNYRVNLVDVQSKDPRTRRRGRRHLVTLVARVKIVFMQEDQKRSKVWCLFYHHMIAIYKY